MATTWNNTDFERLLSDRNYIAAYQYLKSSRLEEPRYSEYSGRIVSAVLLELSRTNKRDDPERQVFLRSILAWIFRDIPGLASIYREQVRIAQGANDPVSGVYQGLRTLNDVAAGRKSVSEGIEEAFGRIRDLADRASEEFRDRYDELVGRGRSGENRAGEGGEDSGATDRAGGEQSRDRDVVNQFLESAERGITEGLHQLGNFFEAARRTAENEEGGGDGSGTHRPDESGQSDQSSQSDSSVHVESENGESIRVDIVDGDEQDSRQQKKSSSKRSQREDGNQS